MNPSTSSEIHFFIGKGGVGKSTTSALAALTLARSGSDTLLVSMDPAHNQRDLFDTTLSEKSRKVSENLAVREIDTDYWISRYLKETRRQIKKTYLYQGAFNLEHHFGVLKFSPGLEEYALLTAFENLVHGPDCRQAMVFDMAPTALSLRFFSLPFVTLIWLEELLKLRRLICDKQEILSKIRCGSHEIERDRVKQKLGHLIDNHRHLRDHFLSDATRVHLVVNADRLSLSEAVRIRKRLAEIGIRIDSVVANKLGPEDDLTELDGIFHQQARCRLPFVRGGVIGLQALEQFAAENRQELEKLRGGPSAG